MRGIDEWGFSKTKKREDKREKMREQSSKSNRRQTESKTTLDERIAIATCGVGQ